MSSDDDSGQGQDQRIADEKYVALTTYRKDGGSSSTAVWIADLGDGTVGFTTPLSSLKVKRLRNDPRVLLQPSDSRGRPKAGSTAVGGTAVVVDGAEAERVGSRIKDTYGWSVTLIRLLARVAKLFGRDQVSDGAVVITLD